MPRKNPNYYQRKVESESLNPFKQVPYDQCNHGPDMWCQACIAHPPMTDMRDIGLGCGFIMGNFDRKEVEKGIREVAANP